MEQQNAQISGRNRKKKRRGDSKKVWDPPIFGKFIWTDSNLFLHEVISTTVQLVFIQNPPPLRASVAGEKLEPLPPSPPPRTSYYMKTDPYRGRDPRDVAGEAISWLEQQIAIAET
jgi:hypothetical protein